MENDKTLDGVPWCYLMDVFQIAATTKTNLGHGAVTLVIRGNFGWEIRVYIDIAVALRGTSCGT